MVDFCGTCLLALTEERVSPLYDEPLLLSLCVTALLVPRVELEADLPDRIVDDFRVYSVPLLIWELFRVCDGLREIVRLPDIEPEL